MAPDQTNNDCILGLFMELFDNTMSRNNPFVAIEMDGEFFYLDDLHSLLDGASIDDNVSNIMENWYVWADSCKYNPDDLSHLETMSFVNE